VNAGQAEFLDWTLVYQSQTVAVVNGDHAAGREAEQGSVGGQTPLRKAAGSSTVVSFCCTPSIDIPPIDIINQRFHPRKPTRESFLDFTRRVDAHRLDG
jgi:hypothetical protein